MDEIRLAQEVVFMADKADINEELVRLCSHLQQMESCLGLKPTGWSAVGILLQEANRSKYHCFQSTRQGYKLFSGTMQSRARKTA